MKDNKKSALQEAREEYLKQQEQEQHINFIKSMENKKLKELSIAQQSYLYKEHNKLYQELKNNPERVIEDLLTLDTLKAREKEREAKLEEARKAFKKAFEEEQEQESNKSEQEKKIEQLIDRAFATSLKKFDLE